jgi:hypothetical protein
MTDVVEMKIPPLIANTGILLAYLMAAVMGRHAWLNDLPEATSVGHPRDIIIQHNGK